MTVRGGLALEVGGVVHTRLSSYKVYIMLFSYLDCETLNIFLNIS